MNLITSIKNKSIQHPLKDIFAGVMVALLSIPIAMGYAQIAGLPVLYGLYGSILPILVFAFLTSSPQFVVGVDAMPAAMIGGLLSALHISAESPEALGFVPFVSILVALCFVIFYFVDAGRVIKYISAPVMSGFISGVGATIILMQIPKLFGGNPGQGELLILLPHIISELDSFNPLAFLLGIGSIVFILLLKKYCPKIPGTILMMLIGALLQCIFHLDSFGVKMLPDISPSLPSYHLPAVSLIVDNLPSILIEAVSIAGVIMAQTLLSTQSYATKYGYEIDTRKELLSYAGMNLAGALVGCCPINGSVSRSKIADSYGAKSQLMSVFASLSMILVLLFGTSLFKYLPIPVLTGVVMTALIGILDFDMFKRLWRDSKNELLIFIASFLGVLLLGTVNGVILGAILSFGELAIRCVVPPTTFVGRIPGHGNFHSLKRNTHAYPIKNTIIYRFSGNLFFANIDRFERDITSAIEEDTKQIVVDCRGISSIDITAVDRLLSFSEAMRMRGIRFYLTEHDSSLNDQIANLGGEALLDNGTIRRTISLALRDAGVNKPYELVGYDPADNADYLEPEEKLAEFEWIFGDRAEEKMLALASETAEEMIKRDTDNSLNPLTAHGATTHWGMLGLFDEHEFWDLLEKRIEERSENAHLSEEDLHFLIEKIEKRRADGLRRLGEINPKALELLEKHREQIMDKLNKK